MSRRALARVAWVVALGTSCRGGSAPPPPRAPAAANCGAPVPDAPGRTARQVVQSAHEGRVSAMAFSASGVLATVGLDDTVRFWDPVTRTLVGVLQHRPIRGARSIAWDARGLRFVVSNLHPPGDGGRGGAWLVRMDRGAEPLPGEHWGAVPVAGGRGLARTSRGLALIDLDACDAPSVVLAESGAAADSSARVATSGDGYTAAHLVAPTEAALWSLAHPERAPRRVALPARTQRIALSPAADVLYALAGSSAAGASGEWAHVVIVPLNGGLPREVAGDFEASTYCDASIVVSGDGATVAIAADDRLAAWDTRSGRPLWTRRAQRGCDAKSEQPGMAIAFSPVAPVLAVRDDRVYVVDARTGRFAGPLGYRRPVVSDAAIGADTLAIAYRDPPELVVWSLRTARVVRRRALDPSYDVDALAVGPDGVAVAVQSDACCEAMDPHRARDSDPRCGEARFIRVDALDASAATAGGAVSTEKPNTLTAIAVDAPWPPRAGTAGYVCVQRDGAIVDAARGVAVPPAEPAPKHKYGASPVAKEARWTVSRGGGFWVSEGDVVTRTGERHVQSPFAAGETPPQSSARCGVAAVWAGDDAARLHTRDGPRTTAVSDDDQRVLRARGDTAVVQAASGSELLRVRVEGGDIRSASFGARPSDFLVGTAGGRLILYRDGAVAAEERTPGVSLELIRVDPRTRRAVVIGGDGVLRIWNAETLGLLASIADFTDGEFAAFTPGGAYAATGDAAARIEWVFDDPLEAFRFEQFSAGFSAPDLVRRRLAGEGTDVAGGLRRPPLVEITSSSTRTAEPIARIHASARSSTRVDLLRAYADGRPAANAPLCAPAGAVDLDVPLLPGPNSVAVVGFDDRGLGSNPARLEIVRDDPRAARPDLWVVSVGIDRYPSLPRDLQLSFAVADARGVASAFEAMAGDALPYARAHVQVLADEEVTVEALRSALGKLAAMRPEDVAVVFFAGHGVKPSADGDMVLVTSGLTMASNGRPLLDGAAIGWRDIANLLNGARGRILVLLDACHSGHVSQEVISPNGDLAATLSAQGRAGIVVFAAATGRQVSYEPSGARGLVLDASRRALSAGGDHGFFTGALLASLAAPDTDGNRDGVLQLSELLDDVSARVMLMTGGKQTPWVARRELFGDFALAAPTPRP